MLAAQVATGMAFDPAIGGCKRNLLRTDAQARGNHLYPLAVPRPVFRRERPLAKIGGARA